ALLGQRKRVALLVYLALAGPGALRSRDAALALFWPEFDQRRARSALRQALYSLRLALGRGVIVSRSDGCLGTSPAALWCDAVAFEQALKSGDLEEALRLYRGDLLPGFFVDDAPGFERWLDEERPRLRRKARDAAWRLAEDAEREGELAIAARWARRSTELSHDDEASLQKLLRLLDRVGDRSGALHAYHEFAVRLAKDFEAAPSAETRRLIDTIRAGGGSGLHRWSELHAPPPATAARVPDAGEEQRALPSLLSGESAVAAVPARPASTPGTIARRAPHRPLARALVWPMAAALAMASLAVLGILLQRTSPPDRSPEPSSSVRIVVNDFTDLTTSSRPGVLGPAITTAVVGQLAAVRSFDIVPASTPSRPRGGGVDTARSPRFLVNGSVLRSGARVRVNVEVIDAIAGSTLETAVIEHESSDSIALVDALSREASSAIRIAIGREVRERGRYLAATNDHARRLSRDAGAEHERAQGLEREGRISAAARALRRADSLLASAEAIAPEWKGPVIERAHIAWELAVLHLMPGSSDAALADSLLGEGIAHAESAVAMDSSDATALETLGLLSYWCWLQAPLASDSAHATLARALSALRRAVGMEPDRASAWSLLSAALYSQADYTGAYLAADRAYGADAYLDDAEEILNRLFMAAYEIGDDAGARRWCDEIERRFRRSWTGAYCRLSLLTLDAGGNPAAARRAFEIAAEGGRHSALRREVRPRLYMLVAAVLARAGLRDSAEITIRRSLVDAAGDPEILPLEASARIFLGQPDVAAARLAQYVRGRPLHRTAVACSRRFAALRSLRSLRRQRGVFRPCTEYSELPEIQGGVYAGGIASRAGYAVDLAVDDDADVLVASEIGRAPNAVDRADQGEDDREPNEDRRLPNSEERFHLVPPVEVNGPPKIGSDVQTRIGNFCQ
ncbi:MAG TPA: BTAD domain-containing putative transcriptional regulator, partial [Gemmatimonadaceae bacterium]